MPDARPGRAPRRRSGRPRRRRGSRRRPRSDGQADRDERARRPRRASARGSTSAAAPGAARQPASVEPGSAAVAPPSRRPSAGPSRISSASAAASSPAIRPPYRTTIRSESVRISSRSELISRTPLPVARRSSSARADELGRGDVDARGSAGRRSSRRAGRPAPGRRRRAARCRPTASGPARRGRGPGCRNAGDDPLAAAADAVEVEEQAPLRRACRHARPTTRLSRMLASAASPAPVAVLRDVAEPGRAPLGDASPGHVPARRRRSVPAVAGRSPATTSASSRLAVAGDPGDARRSRPHAPSRSIGPRPRPRTPSSSRTGRPGSTAGRSRSITTSRPTIARASSRTSVAAAGRSAGDAPVAQHRDLLGVRQHLVEVVADEDDRPALGRQPADRLEQARRPPAA